MSEPETPLEGNQDFLNFLEHLDPLATEINVTSPLAGEIDCGILEKCNFKGITSLVFSPGQIQYITNIPAGITHFVCAENALVNMPELPDSVVEADMHSNFMTSAGPFHAGLKVLNVANNNLDTLEHLPASLETLIVNNNRLTLLNLDGIENLKVLKCSDNSRLVIEGVPDTLTEFQMDNDVATQIEYARADDGSGGNEATTKANYTECLYTYFEMKKVYEDGVRKLRRAAYSSASNKRAARVKLADLKPKCIECARPVGTIFNTEGRMYYARCGDRKQPCVLDIQLFAGEYSSVHSKLAFYKSLIETIKENIMIDKLKVLFHYMSEKDGVSAFKKNLDFYTAENVHLTALTKEYEDLYFSEDRQEKVDAKLKKIQGIQERINELFAKEDADEDSTIIADAMAVYINELVPEIDNLQLIKYDTQECLVDDPTVTLYQTPWRIQQLEYTFGEYPRVVKFSTKSAR